MHPAKSAIPCDDVSSLSCKRKVLDDCMKSTQSSARMGSLEDAVARRAALQSRVASWIQSQGHKVVDDYVEQKPARVILSRFSTFLAFFDFPPQDWARSQGEQG